MRVSIYEIFIVICESFKNILESIVKYIIILYNIFRLQGVTANNCFGGDFMRKFAFRIGLAVMFMIGAVTWGDTASGFQVINKCILGKVGGVSAIMFIVSAVFLISSVRYLKSYVEYKRAGF